MTTGARDALFTELDGSKPDHASFFVQWKGTDVCGDFRCTCGHLAHVCGAEFMYSVRCGACGKCFAVQHTLYMLECEPDSCTVDTE